MKVALIGGHMAPALGLISAFPKDMNVVYIGRETVFEGDTGMSLEQKSILARGIHFIPFRTGRIQRTLTRQTIPSLLKIPKGFRNAFAILKKEKPDVVVAFGGYLSVPIGTVAVLLGIPLVIHESTLEAGLANKMLAKIAKRICISWDSSRAYFPKKKTVFTGNPLLPFNFALSQDLLPLSKEKLPLLVVSGGSGGSHVVNQAVLQILPELLETAKVIHQTGDAKEFGDYEKLTSKKKTLPKKLQDRYSVVKFIPPETVNTVFAKADLVIGRSGINTVAALLVMQKRAILIPLPIGQKDEQLKNAKLMESEGLAHIIEQKTLSPKILFGEITGMLRDRTGEVPKWHIPINKDGGENLMKEVLQCALAHHQEN